MELNELVRVLQSEVKVRGFSIVHWWCPVTLSLLLKSISLSNINNYRGTDRQLPKWRTI